MYGHKTINYFAILSNGLIMLFLGCCQVGCSKDEVKVFQSYFKGKADGISFTCNTGMNINSSPQFNNRLFIGGLFPGGTISIEINTFNIGNTAITPGVYDIETYPGHISCVYSEGVDFHYAGVSLINGVLGKGKVTILEIATNEVKGHFEFTTAITSTGQRIRTITEGSFHIRRIQ